MSRSPALGPALDNERALHHQADRPRSVSRDAELFDENGAGGIGLTGRASVPDCPRR